MTAAWAQALSSIRRVAFDSNSLIYLLEGQQPHAGLVEQALWQVERGLAVGVISTVVEMEVLVRPLREQRIDVVERVDFLLRGVRNIVVRSVDRPIARLAASLRADHRLASPDALIGATAVVERCDTVIGNDRAFARRLRSVPYLCLDDYVN